jgi:transposase
MLGRRTPPPTDLIIALKDLPPPPAHPFYQRLNQLLDEASFDPFVEDLCRPYYCEGFGRPGIPPGVYFRMLLYGYFEGLSSQRGIAWHCADSRSAQDFLGWPAQQPTPDHSSLTKIRHRLPGRIHEQVFVFVLKLAEDKGLIPGPTVAVDSTLLEANASLKTIVRRDSGADWKEYLRQLAVAAGLDNPSDEDLRRFDRQRKGKKVSNQDWVSPGDPDSKIAKMKDGTTHLAYKAEHVVDLDTELVLSAGVYTADQPDSATLLESVISAQVNLMEAESGLPAQELAKQGKESVAELTDIEEVAADKGYHKAQTLATCARVGVRTYIPEARRGQKRVWIDKPADWQRAYRNNRRRVKGSRSKRLQKLRSEKVERTFAHVCETGGGRRSWLRGLVEIGKRYIIQVATHNLGVIMRRVFGRGTPRGLQGAGRPLLEPGLATRGRPRVGDPRQQEAPRRLLGFGWVFVGEAECRRWGAARSRRGVEAPWVWLRAEILLLS